MTFAVDWVLKANYVSSKTILSLLRISVSVNNDQC